MKVEPLDPAHPNFEANLADARETAKALDWGEDCEKPDFGTWSIPTPPAPREAGFVYFIGGKRGFIKVGWAKDVEKRLKALQTGSPTPLRILVAVPGSCQLERDYHDRFRSSRRHGEWFERSAEIEAEIARLQNPQPPEPFGKMLHVEPSAGALA